MIKNEHELRSPDKQPGLARLHFIQRKVLFEKSRQAYRAYNENHPDDF
jgi:hypothetical protein